MTIKTHKCLACNGNGKLTEYDSPRLYLMAYKSYVMRDKDIPEGARSLAVIMINLLIRAVYDIPGKLELSYRRGIQDGEERQLRKKK